MKKVLLAGMLLASSSAYAQTHDSDFPDQMRAINQCYVEAITTHKTAKEIPMERVTANLKTCVESKGFIFCPDCQIFRFSGGPCSKDEEYKYDRATCWRPADAE